jgi:sugar lactone lactonase YvrE
VKYYVLLLISICFNSVFASEPMISTFAGTGTSGFSGDGGSAKLAQLSNGVYGLAVDSFGQLLVADGGNKRLRKIDANGVINSLLDQTVIFSIAVDQQNNAYIADSEKNQIIKMDASGKLTTFAGTGTAGYAGDGGKAVEAQLYYPTKVIVDKVGNVYVSEGKNHTVRKIDVGGIITTIAGTGVAGFSGDGGSGKLAQLKAPWSLVLDNAGNLYIADAGNYRLRKVDPNGIISTILGTGSKGYAGDGGSAISAQTGWIEDLAIDSQNALYLADLDHHYVRKINNLSMVNAFAGRGTTGYAGDGGTATLATLNAPSALAVDFADNLYIGEEGNATIRKITTNLRQGLTIRLAGSGSGKITAPSGGGVGIDCGSHCIDYYLTGETINLTAIPESGSTFMGWGGDCSGSRNPFTITLDISKTCIAAFDVPAQTVAQGQTYTIAGNGTSGFSGDGGSAVQAQLRFPAGLAMDAQNRLYVADALNNRIRRLENGILTTFAGSGTYGFSGDGGSAINAQFKNPAALSISNDGSILVADYGNHRIRKIDPSGLISTIAGMGEFGFSGDNGSANVAQLNFPQGVAIDRTGNVYIADTNNHRIRRVETSGRITTFAGIGTAGFAGDGDFAALSQLNQPTSVRINSVGEIFIADSGNHRIRKIDASGIIRTVAGSGNSGFAGDNSLAINALLNYPRGISFDRDGNVYFADSNNHRIRKVDLNNKISTLAGNGSAGFAGDGNTALSVLFNNPSDILIDNSGNLFVADYANQRVRRIDAHLPQLTISKSGSGNGVVLGTLGVNNEINCGNQCSANYLRNSIVTLSAQPDANSTFDGWQGDCSNASIVMDADKTCTAVFNINQISNLPNCPTTGVISSDCNAAGLTLQNVQISNAVKVYNGTFTGSVFNQGDIINGQFAASALLTGGNVSGTISGVQNAPAQFLQVQIKANTQLSNVVIGQDTHFTNGATIGLGVQFTSANQIPVAGMDLSGVLPKIESACPQVEGSKSIDLNNIIFTQSGVILNNLNAIPFMSQNGFALRSEFGLLKLDIGDSRFIQRPIKINHVLNNSATILPDYVNNLQFLTADHLNVKTHPLLFGICQLYQQFSDWTWTELENGNIRMEKANEAAWISLRPEWVLTKVSADSPRGLQIANSPKRAEILDIFYIGTDSDGQLFKQKIISAPVSPDVLYLASDRNQLQWDSGVLSFVYQGQSYRGVLDFVVTKSPASGAFSLELVGGSQDVILIYPSGDRQRLFVLPP